MIGFASLMLMAGTAAPANCVDVIGQALAGQIDSSEARVDACTMGAMNQSVYEEGMACIGKQNGIFSLQQRIRASYSYFSNREVIESTSQLQASLDELMTFPFVGVNVTRGYAAADAARVRYDQAAMRSHQEQFEIYKNEGALSARCGNVLQYFAFLQSVETDRRADGSL